MKKHISAIYILLALGVLFSGCTNPQNEQILSTTGQQSLTTKSPTYNDSALEPDLDTSLEDALLEDKSPAELSTEYTNPVEITIENISETDPDTMAKGEKAKTEVEIPKPSVPENEYAPDENEMPR